MSHITNHSFDICEARILPTSQSLNPSPCIDPVSQNVVPACMHGIGHRITTRDLQTCRCDVNVPFRYPAAVCGWSENSLTTPAYSDRPPRRLPRECIACHAAVCGWMDGARTLSQPQLILTGRLVGFRENALHAGRPRASRECARARQNDVKPARGQAGWHHIRVAFPAMLSRFQHSSLSPTVLVKASICMAVRSSLA
jgi:hypothetical protein